MSGSIQEKLESLAALDTAGLGQLVRAKTLQAVAMHFMLRGVAEQIARGNQRTSVEEAYRQMRDHFPDVESDTL